MHESAHRNLGHDRRPLRQLGRATAARHFRDLGSHLLRFPVVAGRVIMSRDVTSEISNI